MKRGLITYPGRGSVDGVAGDHVNLAPPLIVQEHQLDDIVAILRSAMLAISHELHLQQGAAREHSSRQPGQENLRHPEPMEKTLLENAENAKINQNKEEHLCAE